MSLMLPDWAEWVLEMLGFDWPTGDEDKMMESAQQWRTFAAAVEQLQSEGVTAAGNVLSANTGDSIDGFSKTWDKFAGGSGYLDDARNVSEMIAVALEVGAGIIIGMKVAVIAQLAILAAEIIAAQAAAPFTFGLSEVGAAAATQATRLIVRRILKEAREALVEAVVETLKEPAVSALEAMISDAIAQGMNMNFGAQNGFDVGRSVKTGAEAGVEAAKNSGQTFAESLRDGAGARAGGHARNGLDSAAGHGNDSGGSDSSSGSDSSGSDSSGSDSSSSDSSGSDSSTSGNSSDSGGSDSGGSDSGGSDSGGSGSSGSDGNTSTGSGGSSTTGGPTHTGGGGTSGTGGTGSTTNSAGESGGSGDSGDTGGSTPSAASPDSSTAPGTDGGDRTTPQAQPLPPPDQRSPFDEGFAGNTPDSSTTPGAGTTPDSGPTPDSGNTPDSSPTPGTGNTPDSGTTPDGSRPDPDTVSTQPTADNTPDSARPDTDQVSTQPAPDNTPDSARPDTDQVSTQPTPGPSPHPDSAPTPDSGPGPGPDQSHPTPSRPDTPAPDSPSQPDAAPPSQSSPSEPIAGNPPTADTPTNYGDATNNGNNGNNGDDNNSGGGRGSIPHANVPSQGAPVQHSPSSGPPVQQRDPAPGDPMPTVDDDAADPAVRTQSADTMTAPPPSALADQNNAPGNTPNSPQQAPQSSPQAAGPVMGAPGMAPQGTPTPTAAPPRGSTTPSAGNPPHGTPPNARPGGIQQRTPDRPAFTPRPDGPRPDQQRPRAGDPRTPHTERPGGIPSQQRPNGTGQQPPRQQQPQPQNDRPDPRQQPSQQRPAGENPDSSTPSSPTTPRPETPQHQSPDASQAPTGTDNGDPRADRPQDSRPDQPDGPSNRAPDTDNSNTSDNDNRNESDSGNNADSGPDKDSNDSGNDSDPSNQRPDHPDATDESTSPRDQDSGPTPDTDPDSDAAHDPAPASETRNRERPGGLEGPSDEHQQHVEDSIPKDENGEPQRHPDPDDGNWVDSINDPGPDAPGRSNNCVDSALATADTYAGNPTAAAHRTPDTNDDGTPSDRGESNGRDRIENTLGARFNDYGNGKDAFNSLENDLRDSGHGSQAVIITQDSNGRAHAWNAVNHNGKITYVDSQTGQRSDKPLHDGSNGVHAIPLDPNRRPVDNSGTATRPDAEGARRPAAEPAGKHKQAEPSDGKDTEEPAPKKPKNRPARETREALQQPLNSNQAEGTPGYGVEQGPDHTAQGMLGDEAQQRLRQTHTVRQVNWDRVLGNLDGWADRDADSGRSPLGDAFDHIRQNKRIDENDLNHILGDDYRNLPQHERLATVSCLARMSYDYHAQHTQIDGHDINPEGLQHHKDHKAGEGKLGDSRGRAIEYQAQQNVPEPDDMTKEEAKQYRRDLKAERDRIKNALDGKIGDQAALPDFSGRNYAVFEVTETDSEGKPVGTHFIVGSSVPAGGGVPNPDHSEPAAGEGLRQLDGNRFTRTAMFTEYEPCGNAGDLGGAACSHYISENLDRPAGEPRNPHGEMKKQGLLTPPDHKSPMEVSYGTSYRYGKFAEGETTKEAQDAVKQQWKDDMDRVRGELLGIWMKVHA
ncbi:toxin glutamine deamidase domain-containing protein [Streptomyces sp. NPDC091266]|uniref:toxin glutamine deamidase domain-containing protein n=1 Tax=Streptomyces sp. NPDC091266 TaxID=3365978 RepID=UPI003825F94E